MSNTTPPQLRSVREYALPTDALSVAWQEHANRLFVGGTVGQIYHIDLAAGETEPDSWLAHLTHVSGLGLAGGELISVGSDHDMVWWDLQTRATVRRRTHAKWIRQLAISVDGTRAATVCDDMIARVWEAPTGRLVHELRRHALHTPYDLPSKLYACAFSPDGQLLATADQLGFVFVWDVESGQCLAEMHGPNFFTHDTNGHGYGGIRTVVFSPDGKHIAAGGNQAGDTSQIAGSKSLVHVYDWKSGTRVAEFTEGGNFFYERLAYHRQGDWLVAAAGAGAQQKVAFFSVAQRELLTAAASPLLVFDMRLSARSDRLVTVGRQNKKGCVVQWVVEPQERPPAPSTEP